MKVSELTDGDGREVRRSRGRVETLRELIKSETRALQPVERDVDETMDERFKSEGEETRRHFDEMDERITQRAKRRGVTSTRTTHQV